MTLDIRAEAAKYYDLQPSPFEGRDLPFYVGLLPSPDARVLELGCGTGRVLVPMSQHCAYLHGVDLSESMMAICREKLAQAGIAASRAQAEVGDITRLALNRQFDLITAPFRVFQNLETDDQIDHLFAVIRAHLKPGGSGVLNVFRPFADETTVRQRWASNDVDRVSWEQPVGTGRVLGYERIARVDESKLICYPVLTYRYYEGDKLKDEAALKIAMRCYYPAEFERLITTRGFNVLGKWGGYNGEAYGQGPELVIQFSAA